MTTKMLTSLASQGFMLSYGTLSLGAFLLLAFSKKNSFRKLGTQGKKELAIGIYEFTFVLELKLIV